jgi:hypothetical protein
MRQKKKMARIWIILHYSRTCCEPEEIIDLEKRETLARVHVRLEAGSDVLQAGKR